MGSEMPVSLHGRWLLTAPKSVFSKQFYLLKLSSLVINYTPSLGPAGICGLVDIELCNPASMLDNYEGQILILGYGICLHFKNLLFFP